MFPKDNNKFWEKLRKFKQKQKKETIIMPSSKERER